MEKTTSEEARQNENILTQAKAFRQSILESDFKENYKKAMIRYVDFGILLIATVINGNRSETKLQELLTKHGLDEVNVL